MTVGSVVNAIAILRHLAASEPQGVNAIARAAGLSPSSCFNILKTLVGEGFVDFDDATKAYGLGTAPARIFGNGADFAQWKAWLIDSLDQMARQFSVSCGLWEVRGARLVLTDAVDSPLTTRIHLTVGQRLPAHIGAMGRCIAAHEALDREQVAAAIAELRWQSPPSVDDYLADVDAAREQGWALDDGNYLRGVTTIGVAIENDRAAIGHCLSSTAFSGQHDAATLREIGAAMADLARQSARRLRAG